jgi:hypothetical protein
VKKDSSAESSLPTKQVLEELRFLRGTLREVVNHYLSGLEGEIAQLATMVTNEGELKKPPRERAHDLRDILMHLRELDLRPEKGRRRDLKRIETLLAELRAIADRW